MDLGRFEESLGYIFTDKSLLQAALTHRSYAFENHCDNNQRMEFLGDAILDFVIADELYRRYPEAIPPQSDKSDKSASVWPFDYILA